MNDSETMRRRTRRDIYGASGGSYGPLMFSTNTAILLGTVDALLVVALFGLAAWMSVAVVGGSVGWGLALAVAVVGAFVLHIVLIEIFAVGMRTAARSASESVSRITEDSR